MVTQVEIAHRVGLDVSSVNKILNRRSGPVFRKETIWYFYPAVFLLKTPTTVILLILAATLLVLSRIRRWRWEWLFLGLPPAFVDSRAEQALEPDERDRLVEERVDAEAGGRLGAVGRAVGGEDDDRRGVTLVVTQERGDGEPLRPHIGREAHVGDDRVERVAGQPLRRFLQGGGAVDLEPGPGEVGLVDSPHAVVVVDHQDAFTHARTGCKRDAQRVAL